MVSKCVMGKGFMIRLIKIHSKNCVAFFYDLQNVFQKELTHIYEKINVKKIFKYSINIIIF